MAAYATVEEYRLDTGDSKSDDERVSAVLEQQSAKLRALAGLSASRKLTEDQATLCRMLVTDASRKMLVPAFVEGMGDVAGVTQDFNPRSPYGERPQKDVFAQTLRLHIVCDPLVTV